MSKLELYKDNKNNNKELLKEELQRLQDQLRIEKERVIKINESKKQ